mgnify:FL=1
MMNVFTTLSSAELKGARTRPSFSMTDLLLFSVQFGLTSPKGKSEDILGGLEGANDHDGEGGNHRERAGHEHNVDDHTGESEPAFGFHQLDSVDNNSSQNA